MRAYGSIVEGPIPEMAQTAYQGSGFNHGLNMALSIGGGILAGAKAGAQMDAAYE